MPVEQVVALFTTVLLGATMQAVDATRRGLGSRRPDAEALVDLLLHGVARPPPSHRPREERLMLIKLLKVHLKPYQGAVIAVVLLQLVQTMATLYLPSLNARIIDDGVVKGDTAEILRLGGVMLAVSFVQVVAAIIAVYYGSRTAMAFGRDVRERLFGQVQTFSAQEVAKFGAPTLITRTTNDVQQVQMVTMMTFTMMIMAPIMLVGGVIMAMREDVVLSGILLVSVPVLGLIIGLIISRMVPYFRAMQKRIDGINRVLREQIAGVRVVRAFVRERRESQRFDGANAELYDTSLRVGQAHGADVPVGHGRAEHHERRGAVVRRLPRRLRRHADRPADGVPVVHRLHPDRGDDVAR